MSVKAQAGQQSGRKIVCSDIQLVQNLIERCLQLYMNEKEVVSTLQTQAQIEPGFTHLVWQKLEEQNPDFFRAYYTRLKVKDQIILFNHLLDQQVSAVQAMHRTFGGMPPPPGPMPPGMPGAPLPFMGGFPGLASMGGLSPIPGARPGAAPPPQPFQTQTPGGSEMAWSPLNASRSLDASGDFASLPHTLSMSSNDLPGLMPPGHPQAYMAHPSGGGPTPPLSLGASHGHPSNTDLHNLPRNFSLSDLDGPSMHFASLGETLRSDTAAGSLSGEDLPDLPQLDGATSD